MRVITVKTENSTYVLREQADGTYACSGGVFDSRPRPEIRSYWLLTGHPKPGDSCMYLEGRYPKPLADGKTHRGVRTSPVLDVTETTEDPGPTES